MPAAIAIPIALSILAAIAITAEKVGSAACSM
jgi:hypothetical protein